LSHLGLLQARVEVLPGQDVVHAELADFADARLVCSLLVFANLLELGFRDHRQSFVEQPLPA
jgi:hypothetical protein